MSVDKWHFVSLDMKGCICHFAKWQIHPFISKEATCIIRDCLCSYLCFISVLMAGIAGYRAVWPGTPGNSPVQSALRCPVPARRNRDLIVGAMLTAGRYTAVFSGRIWHDLWEVCGSRCGLYFTLSRLVSSSTSSGTDRTVEPLASRGVHLF